MSEAGGTESQGGQGRNEEVVLPEPEQLFADRVGSSEQTPIAGNFADDLTALRDSRRAAELNRTEARAAELNTFVAERNAAEDEAARQKREGGNSVPDEQREAA